VIFSIILLILLLLAPLPAHSDDCKRAVELYNQGTVSKNVDEKERCFQDAISLCTDREVLSRTYNNLADVFEQKGEYSQALRHYRKAIKIKNDLTTAYTSVADVFLKLGDYYSAFIMYGKGLKYSPDDEDTLRGKEKSEEGFKKKMVIYFDLNSSQISDLYLYRLEVIGEAIRNNSNKIRVEVTGHTCDLGRKPYNRTLSRKRAKAVSSYLKEHFSISGIIITGKGEDSPLLPNRDDEARTLNRRVEVKVLELL
jgi:outer membrane protein OmpA-like peptidoglycan-associated protein